MELYRFDAGWSSLAARRAHNPKVVGSNPAPATNFEMPTKTPLLSNLPSYSAKKVWLSPECDGKIAFGRLYCYWFLFELSCIQLRCSP